MSLLDEASKAAIERYLEIAESSKYRTGKANQKSVGMTEFVSKEVPGMKFEVKQKCRDFLVQEIPRSKAPLVLKNCQLPQTECDFYRLKRKRKFERTNYPTKEIACIEAEKILRELLPQKEKNSVLAFLKEADKEEAALKIEKKLNKEDRKLVHQMISKNFSLFDSETVNGEAESSLKNIKIFRKVDGTKLRSNPTDNFFKDNEKQYLHFSVLKGNCTTADAVSALSSKMRLRPKLFSFCGNKDRKAVTIQRVCAKRITAKRVRDVSRFSRRLFVGDFEYQVRPLSLGQLDGNRFNIVLRKIEKKRKNDFEAISESIKENGFINYFGLQRFGSCSVPTHNFGKLVLKRQWDELVALILFTDEIGKLPTQHRKIAETLKNKKSFSEALKHCPKHLSVERPVLERLSQNINSRDAFNSIARQTKSIYVHAFQSYIWNKAASARLKKYGFSPVVGDLVVLGKEQGMAQSSGRKTKTLVRSLGKADVDSGDFSIFDVVLPLPCAGCELPRNEAGEIYEAELKKEGISDQLVEKLRKDRSLIIYPNYRPLMMRCLNFKSKFGSGLENSLPVEQPELIENGSFSEMVNEQLVDRTLGEEQSSKTVDCEKKSGIIIDREKFCAAQLQFDLPSSCYATSLLREFSK